jgi:NAD(P)-dependent dehydrogenase (short-subunit alcohol dehydrogenase family)
MVLDNASVLIVGSGSGLSASLPRLFAREGFSVVLAARDTTKLADICAETHARAFACDVSDPGQVAALFEWVDQEAASLGVAIFNTGVRVRGPLVDLDAAEVERSVTTNALGAFYVAQQAAKRMLPRGSGAILFTGVSASIKGYPHSTPFAMGKFALRGLAQSMARELAPNGIHVAHFVIDGQIRNPARSEPADQPDSMLDPDAIAASYLHVVRQPRSAWTHEVELRPWVEKF